VRQITDFAPTLLQPGSNTSYTYEYANIRRNANISYYLDIWEHRTNANLYWLPIEALNISSSDKFIMFLEQNSVSHWKPNKDPIFAATQAVGDTTVTYRADRMVSPMVCTQQHRFCNPNNAQCSAWTGRFEALKAVVSVDSPINLNINQLATASRIFLASLGNSLYEAINSRPSMALRAQTKMDWLFQIGLPDNQWEIEVLNWVQQGMASLQTAIQEYAAGPTLDVKGGVMQVYGSETDPATSTPEQRAVNLAYAHMCGTQIVHDAQGTLNFSLLGVSVVFVLGIFIIIFSFIVEPLTAWVQRMLGKGVQRANAWQRDDGLHTLRLLFETHQRGSWKGESDVVPVTVHPNEVFFYPEAAAHGPAREVYQAVPMKGDDKSA